tara:strand:+ start:466 stop:1062 length:597 start_codon:yes stop_codon:yes gene_type:complete
MVFDYEYILKIKKIIKLFKLKNLEILDYGCGKGVWSLEEIESTNELKKVILFDNNQKLIPFLKKKYKSEKVEVIFDLKKIVEKNYNIIIFSSVIQYIDPNELKKIIYQLSSNKKDILILLSDIPFLPRYIELFLTPFFNLKRFFFIIKLIFSNEYKKLNYFTYEKRYFEVFEKNFKVTYEKNLHDLKFLRYSIILKIL